MKRTILQSALCAALPTLLSGCYGLPVGSKDIDRIDALVREARQQPPRVRRRRRLLYRQRLEHLADVARGRQAVE